MDMMNNGDFKKLLVALLTIGIVGAWSFAATRASSDDIESVRQEIKEVEAEAKERDAKLAHSVDQIQKTIHAEAIAAATFRAQVRTALEIRETPGL